MQRLDSKGFLPPPVGVFFFYYPDVGVSLASGPIRGHFWCRSGAVGTENMEIVDFIAIFAPTFGGYTEIIPHIYGIDFIDARLTGLPPKSLAVLVAENGISAQFFHLEIRGFFRPIQCTCS